MKLSVIIPMYNEKAIAADCAKALIKKLDSDSLAHSYSYEIIFSDDGSTDGCGDTVRSYAAKNPPTNGSVSVITSEKNEGKGSAVRHGMLCADGDYILFTDCDLAYGVDIIPEMFRCAVEVSERDSRSAVVIGSRAISKDGYAGYTFLRKAASKIFKRLLCLTAGFSHSDSQSGLKIFRRDAAHDIFSNCVVNGWSFDFEALMIAEKLGYGIREYPVKIINHRSSKINLLSDTLKMLSDVRQIKKRVSSLEITPHKNHDSLSS